MTAANKTLIQSLFIDGKTTKEIAFEVGLNLKTVQRLVSPMRNKELFSPSERYILVAIANGLSTKEISAELRLSIQTINTYRIHLMEKTNCRNSCQLIAWGFKNKYLI